MNWSRRLNFKSEVCLWILYDSCPTSSGYVLFLLYLLIKKNYETFNWILPCYTSGKNNGQKVINGMHVKTSPLSSQNHITKMSPILGTMGMGSPQGSQKNTFVFTAHKKNKRSELIIDRVCLTCALSSLVRFSVLMEEIEQILGQRKQLTLKVD